MSPARMRARGSAWYHAVLFVVAACSASPRSVPADRDAAADRPLPDAATNGADLGLDAARDDAPAPSPDALALSPDAAPSPDVIAGPRDGASPDGPDSAVGAPAIEPEAHEFRPTVVGSSDTFTFMVVNHSGTITTLSLSVDGADFALVPAEDYCTGATHLGPGGFCLFDVQFRPLSRGQKSGTVVFSVDGRSVTAALTGTGTTP